MIDKETETNFKFSVIRCLEENLLIRLANLDPDATVVDGVLWDSPRVWKVISNKENHRNRLTFIDKFLKAPEDYWRSKYKLLDKFLTVGNNTSDLKKLLTKYNNYLNEEKIAYFFEKGRQLHENLLISHLDVLPKHFNEHQVPENTFDKITQHIFYTTNLAVQFCVLIVTSKLIEKINIHNLSLSELEEILCLTEEQHINADHKLEEITGLPTPPPLRAAIKAYTHPDEWEIDENNNGVFKLSCKAKTNNSIRVFLLGENNSDILSRELVYEAIKVMGTDAIKLILLFASYLLQDLRNWHRRSSRALLPSPQKLNDKHGNIWTF